MSGMLLTAVVTALLGQAGNALTSFDHSAYRVDAEVIGWSRDLSQMAVVASTQKRGPRGRIDGEVMIVVFGTDSITPLQNIQMGLIVLADHPQAPHKLDEAPKQLKSVDTNTSKLWMRRPKKKKPAGGMSIEPIADLMELGDDVCQPAVGFLLKKGGELRYQLHQIVNDLRASCELLRLTDVRTTWVSPEVGAALARFDYSPSNNEMSFRQPFPVAWRNARPLKLRVRTTLPAEDPEVKPILESLRKYGKVTLELQEKPPETHKNTTKKPELSVNLQHIEALRGLGARLTRETKAKRILAPPETGDDVLVTITR
jgi:hypothetical protein